MQEVLQTTILSLYEWVDMSNAAVAQVFDEELPSHIWSYDIALKWMQRRIDDELNQTLRWTRSSSDAEDLLKDTILFHAEQTGGGSLVDNVREALDRTEVFIIDLIDYHVSDNPWRIWHTNFKADYVVLEYDIDYRIKVFNEKVAEGEWEA